MFSSGSTSEIQQAAFIANEDTEPEAAESFVLIATIFNGAAAIVNPTQSLVTIPANDDAFGVVGFDAVSKYGNRKYHHWAGKAPEHV